jgi:hypothetical protein
MLPGIAVRHAHHVPSKVAPAASMAVRAASMSSTSRPTTTVLRSNWFGSESLALGPKTSTVSPEGVFTTPKSRSRVAIFKPRAC